jgi:UDPglucose--hexose-1-phosphate uridylyltransferase
MLADAPVEQIYRLLRVWADRYETLGSLDYVKYVLEFESRGEDTSAWIDHPHGEIHAYPFVPPNAARELACSREHEDRTGGCLLCDIVAEERREGRRVVAENESFVAVVPFFARSPYEVHVYARRHLQALSDLDEDEHRDLAEIMKVVLVAYGRRFGRTVPYVMSLHQRPTDGLRYDYYHLHVELAPSAQSADVAGHLAGSGVGAGTLIDDTRPEAAAAELRTHVVPVTRASEARRRGLPDAKG